MSVLINPDFRLRCRMSVWLSLQGGIQGAAQGIQMVGGIMSAMNSYQQWAAGGSSDGGLPSGVGNINTWYYEFYFCFRR